MRARSGIRFNEPWKATGPRGVRDAKDDSWCANYGGVSNCGYSSSEQCRTLPAVALSLVTTYSELPRAERNGGLRPGKMSVPALVQPLLQGLHRLFEILDAEL